MQDHETVPSIPDESNSTASDLESIDESTHLETEADSAPETSEPAVSIEEEEERPKEESRARKTFRKFIRWAVGLLIVFGLGFLTAVFTIYNPKVDELDQSQNILDGAGNTISDLESQISTQQDEIGSLNAQIDSLNTKIDTLNDDKQTLFEQQNGYDLQVALLKARADIASAQVKLYEGNPTQARVLLESASQTLTIIESLLPDDLKDIVAPLQARLELAIGGINDDPETAIADLSKIAGDLHEIENAKVWE